MALISFDNGIKTYDIADKDGNIRGTIRVNTTDYNFFSRVEDAKKGIREILASLNAEENEEAEIARCDREVKTIINDLFDYDRTSEIVFGNTNCLSTVGGNTLVENFLNAILPIIENDFKEEIKASQKRINRYTEGI